MPGIIDMHCHVLPGVDDGPKTVEESVETVKRAASQGIDRMILTPHFHPGRFMVTAQQVLGTMEYLRQKLNGAGIGMELYPGQECYYYTGLVPELDKGNALTLAGSAFVLLEFDPDVLYSRICFGLQDLISNGYRPIIAHYERYRCLYGNEHRLEELHLKGAYLQLNFDRVLDADTFLKRNPWRRHIKDGFVDFLGSDTHGLTLRPLHADTAVNWLNGNVDAGDVHRILTMNPSRILNAKPA